MFIRAHIPRHAVTFEGVCVADTGLSSPHSSDFDDVPQVGFQAGQHTAQPYGRPPVRQSARQSDSPHRLGAASGSHPQPRPQEVPMIVLWRGSAQVS